LHNQDSITAKIIADSISSEGIRITTFHLRYWRAIHSEFMTHRKVSKNGRSSRAVPFVTLVNELPYIPQFYYNQKGMQPASPLSLEDQLEAERIWLDLVEYTKTSTKKLSDLGIHKQWVNRPLEWFGYIDVLATATNWKNFYALRNHEDAQIEIHILAEKMLEAHKASKPTLLMPGEWHLPYVRDEDWDIADDWLAKQSIYPTDERVIAVLKKISAARCARVSYAPFDGNGSIEAEIKRYNYLINSELVHASPIEHQATPDTKSIKHGSVQFGRKTWDNPKLHGNFIGYIQNRKTVPGEYVPDDFELMQ
jgi:hypothetical protein